MRKKLVLMEKNFKKNGYHVGDEKNAQNMKLCINLLDRLIAEDYDVMAFKKHKKKWGDSYHVTTPTENKYLANFSIEYKNANTAKEKDLQEKDFKRCWEHKEKLEKQDIDLLFKIIKKHYAWWWD
jgi:hypothetical protein